MQFDQLKRREFITLLGGAAAWPLAAHAQQPAVPVIGYLVGGLRADDGPERAAFLRGLGETGFVEGRNVQIEYRYGENQGERLPALAADLVERQVAVIAAEAPADAVAKRATQTIPIVFMSGADPVRSGLVSSLNHPGENLTGVTLLSSDLMPKRLGLLHDLVPQATVIAMLIDDAFLRAGESELADLETAGRSIGLRIVGIRLGRERDFEMAFANIVREGAGAIVVRSGGLLNRYRDLLVGLAERHGIPAIYQTREWADSGGLMAYGPSVLDAMRQVGIYTGRILKGDKPAGLPVQLPSRFELVINLKAAKTLGLMIPPGILALADEVIE
jgi:putative tryptophan/tyrosine transport system substrate-binding protein